MMKTSKKLDSDELANEEFEMKSYMKELTYNDALLKFRMRGRILKTVKTHFKSDKRYTEDLWSCEECQLLDTSSHILNKCPKYEALRKEINPDDDKDVVSFFRDVIKERERYLDETT